MAALLSLYYARFIKRVAGERLADFLCIDFDLIAAAAEQSKNERDPMLSKEEISDWVANLPLEDKNAALVR